jgi:hypothetical protein
MWKNGTGLEESVSGGPPGIVATTASTLHGACVELAVRSPDGAVLPSAAIYIGCTRIDCATYLPSHSYPSFLRSLPYCSTPQCDESIP